MEDLEKYHHNNRLKVGDYVRAVGSVMDAMRDIEALAEMNPEGFRVMGNRIYSHSK